MQTQVVDAPPKQVALAMDRLGNASRLVADIRLGADRLLEALFVSSQPHLMSSNKTPFHFFLKEDASIRHNLEELRSIGRQLEESGVLSDSLRSRSNSWGLHMPLVCPDGAVVAYAWKRQLAGQAGASAVDRTRLALKAFTDQKRRFFPHLDDGIDTASKKHCNPAVSTTIIEQEEDLHDCNYTLSDVILRLQKEVPTIHISLHQRLDWFKTASTLPSSSSSSSSSTPTFTDSSIDHSFYSSTILKPALVDPVSSDKFAVIELLFPSVFRAVVSLHPAGSIEPDAVAFFSPDEGGSYVHARGISVYHVFKHITDHAATALQFFLGTKIETALYFLLRWICSYQTLFTKVCSKCGRLLSMDKQTAIFLPPVNRPYRQLTAIKSLPTQANSFSKDHNLDFNRTCHVGCFSDELETCSHI